MKTLIHRITGLILIVAAIAGALFCLLGLLGTWSYKASVTTSLLNDLAGAESALEVTAQGLVVATQSLSNTITSVQALELTVQATADTVQATTPMIATLATLTGKDLPNTVTTAQNSLDAAQQSAKIIDNVLSALTVLPFVTYNPPVPLDVALAQVSESLNGLPDSLKTIQTSLQDTGDNLAVIQTDVDLIAENIKGIETSLQEAQLVLEQYQALVSNFQVRLQRIQNDLPAWIDLTALLLSFIFIWAGLAQIGLFLQGWELLHAPPIGR